MPRPEEGEALSDYVGKFMSDKRDSKWPRKQRAAIAYSEYREMRKKRKKS